MIKMYLANQHGGHHLTEGHWLVLLVFLSFLPELANSLSAADLQPVGLVVRVRRGGTRIAVMGNNLTFLLFPYYFKS